MAFTPPTPQIPTLVQRVMVVLTDVAESPLGPAEQSAHYHLVVLDQDGMPISFLGASGNLVPHLTAEQIQGLQTFMAAMRAKAEAEILGGGE